MPQTARMFCLWMTAVVVDGMVSATMSPSNTAGYLTLVGCAAVVLWAALSGSETKYS